MADTAYIVLDANSREQLADVVNNALKQAWICQGGISVCQVLQKRAGTTNLSHFLKPERMSYTQAMTKTQE